MNVVSVDTDPAVAVLHAASALNHAISRAAAAGFEVSVSTDVVHRVGGSPRTVVFARVVFPVPAVGAFEPPAPETSR